MTQGEHDERTWQYRFSRPGGDELETSSFHSDEEADTHARSLSRDQNTPVVIERFLGHVDWEYVTEADNRP